MSDLNLSPRYKLKTRKKHTQKRKLKFPPAEIPRERGEPTREMRAWVVFSSFLLPGDNNTKMHRWDTNKEEEESSKERLWSFRNAPHTTQPQLPSHKRNCTQSAPTGLAAIEKPCPLSLSFSMILGSTTNARTIWGGWERSERPWISSLLGSVSRPIERGRRQMSETDDWLWVGRDRYRVIVGGTTFLRKKIGRKRFTQHHSMSAGPMHSVQNLIYVVSEVLPKP